MAGRSILWLSWTFLEYKVDSLSYFGRVNKAVDTELSGCLREGGGKGGDWLSRGCGFSDDYARVHSSIGFVPDDLIWLFAEDCFKQRHDSFDMEVVGVDNWKEIVKEAFAATARR